VSQIVENFYRRLLRNLFAVVFFNKNESITFLQKANGKLKEAREIWVMLSYSFDQQDIVHKVEIDKPEQSCSFLFYSLLAK